MVRPVPRPGLVCLPSRPLIFAAALAATATLASACIRDSSKNGGKAPNNTVATRVGNSDPRGVDDQPDWNSQARELKQRVDPRMPTDLPTDKRATCEAMLDEATSFYISVEADPDQRAARMTQLQQTRERDVQGCIEQTSVAAALCVTILLRDRDSEFPWLLDQCSRAYPSETGGGPVGAASPNPGSSPSPSKKADALELALVGDIIFGRYREDDAFDAIVEPDKVTDKQPLAGPFAELEAALRADVVVGNLETPVVATLPEVSPIHSKFRFGGGRAEVQMLADAGFTVLSLANNHAYDLKRDGQLESPKVLASVGITPVGASRTEAPLYRVDTHVSQGWRIGFISVTNRLNAPVPSGTPTAEEPQIPYIELRDMPTQLLPVIAAARQDHDLLVVAVHWGDEYAEAPSGAQQRVARELIDGGVDIVFGHHPHVLQGIERYGQGLIAYSLGNFLFENTGEIPRLTGVLRARFVAGESACLEAATFHPAYVKRTPYPHPTAATGGMGKKVRARVVHQAAGLGTSFVEVDGSEDLSLDGLPACPGS